MKTSEQLYPFSHNYLDLDGLKYHYVDEGSGGPMVMVHGNPTWSFYYRRLISRFSDRYRCIVPDHMGCGFSDKPGDDRYEYSFDRRARDLEALLDHLEIDGEITLVVHDWGGMIGFLYAHRFPEKIKRLVIFNTGAFHLPKSKPFPWPLWLGRDTKVGAYLIRRFGAFSRVAARVCCTRRPLSPEVREALVAPYDSWDHRIATLRFVQDIPLRPEDRGYDLITEVQENLTQFRDRPALICWGMKDFVFDRHFLREFEGYLPNAEVHRFYHSGHYVIEDAHREVAALMEDFLGRT